MANLILVSQAAKESEYTATHIRYLLLHNLVKGQNIGIWLVDLDDLKRYEAEMSANVAENLQDTKLVSIENSKVTIKVGRRTDWLNAQLVKSVTHELKLSGYEVEEVKLCGVTTRDLGQGHHRRRLFPGLD